MLEGEKGSGQLALWVFAWFECRLIWSATTYEEPPNAQCWCLLWSVAWPGVASDIAQADCGRGLTGGSVGLRFIQFSNLVGREGCMSVCRWN